MSADLRAAYWQGFRAASPFILVIVPFGLLFGVVGTEAGLNLAEVMGFSILVIAGASQFTAVQMMTENAPVLMVLATSLAVNLRMAMYSASLTPHLGAAAPWHKILIAYFMVDQSYATAIQYYDQMPQRSLGEKLAFYAGACTPVCPQWYLTTWLGATLGAAIPESFALDFAVPITFLAMLAPLLRSIPHLAAALVSVILSLLLAFLPSGVGLLIAALAAMMVGARVEIWLEKRKAQS